MNAPDRIRLQHMLEMAGQTEYMGSGRTRADLDTDPILQLALARAIEIIGEAASKVSHEYQETAPQIPWAQIIGMRNRLIHAYFDINLNVLWTTITDNIPSLVTELEKLLSPEQT